MGYEKSKTGSNRERKGKPAGDSTTHKLSFGDYRFVRIELTTDEKDDAREYIKENAALAFDPTAYLAANYSVKFSHDSKGGGVVCTVTCSNPDVGDRGLQLTGRGSTAAVAWLMFLYKDLVICADRSWKEAESERGGSYDDIG